MSHRLTQLDTDVLRKLALGIVVFFLSITFIFGQPKLVPNKVTLKNGKSFRLSLPAEFEIIPAAEGLKRVRFFAKSPDGRIFVTDMFNLTDNRKGSVYTLDGWNAKTGKFAKVIPYMTGLKNPNSVQFYRDAGGQDWFYLAETDKLTRRKFTRGETKPTDNVPQTLATFPDHGLSYKYGGWHLTRTIAFSPAGKLYVSVGSSCNACVEKEKVRAMVIEMNPDGSEQREFARGLRNAVGLKWIGNFLWASGQGADHLGPQKPDETFYALKDGADYGWPYCYSVSGKIFADPAYKRPEGCKSVAVPYAYFPSHASALGFDYWDESESPDTIKNAFLVSLHGSTNKAIGHGYKIVIMRKGEKIQDFISGFLQGGKVVGRPCDIMKLDANSFLFTDDNMGIVYLVRKKDTTTPIAQLEVPTDVEPSIVSNTKSSSNWPKSMPFDLAGIRRCLSACDSLTSFWSDSRDTIFIWLAKGFMNIGITVYPTYGGSGIVGSELGRDLAERGHNVHFISSFLPTRLTELSERIHFHEVEMMSYPLFEHQPYDLALATKMATVARAEKLDLLHVHYAIPHSISAILARESIKQKRYVPVITTLHGTDITLVGADRSYLPITRYGLQQSDGVTAVSKFLKQATIETFDFDEIEVIPNFICQNHYLRLPDSPLRAELAPNCERLLVHVSNFRPVKRPNDCVEILAKVRAAGESAKLVMVGDGPELSAVRYRGEQLGVNGNVVYVGKQANIADYLGVADVFLLPSELESFGLAALEAQACEVPVIATRIGGIPEVVNDGESGFLSDVGDIEKMSADTLVLLRNEKLRRAFGEKGRELAVQRYSTSKIIPQYIAFYEKIVKKAKAAAA